MWQNVIKKEIEKKSENFKNCTQVWKSCTANFRVNISTSTAEIVLVGISVYVYMADISQVSTVPQENLILHRYNR